MDTRLTVPGIVDDCPETVGAHSRSTALPAGSWRRFRGALFAYSWTDWDAFAKAAEAREFTPSRRLYVSSCQNLSVDHEPELRREVLISPLSATPAYTSPQCISAQLLTDCGVYHV
jgi:hypothetical protein